MNASEICTGILRQERAYNETHDILPSENSVIDRMLARHLELADAFAELSVKLG